MRQRKTRWPDLRIRHYGAPYDDSTGGNFARTGIPDALSSATYNANNQVTQRGGTSFSYDQNGNLTADAGKTYNWNGRNELVSVSGAVSASFQYDALGRRTSKIVGGLSTSYLYDGTNIVQESSGGSPVAGLLN